MSRELSCQSTGVGELPVGNGRVGEWGLTYIYRRGSAR